MVKDWVNRVFGSSKAQDTKTLYVCVEGKEGELVPTLYTEGSDNYLEGHKKAHAMAESLRQDEQFALLEKRGGFGVGVPPEPSVWGDWNLPVPTVLPVSPEDALDFFRSSETFSHVEIIEEGKPMDALKALMVAKQKLTGRGLTDEPPGPSRN